MKPSLHPNPFPSPQYPSSYPYPYSHPPPPRLSTPPPVHQLSDRVLISGREGIIIKKKKKREPLSHDVTDTEEKTCLQRKRDAVVPSRQQPHARTLHSWSKGTSAALPVTFSPCHPPCPCTHPTGQHTTPPLFPPLFLLPLPTPSPLTACHIRRGAGHPRSRAEHTVPTVPQFLTALVSPYLPPPTPLLHSPLFPRAKSATWLHSFFP